MSHGREVGYPGAGTLAAICDADIIVYGHTHLALVERTPRGALVVNPGAAGPQRFGLSPSVAVLTIEDGAARVEVLALIGR